MREPSAEHKPTMVMPIAEPTQNLLSGCYWVNDEAQIIAALRKDDRTEW